MIAFLRAAVAALVGCLVAVTALSTSWASAAATGAAERPYLDGAGEWLDRVGRAGFHGTVLIARDGEVVERRSYGRAADDPAVAATSDTVWDLGSIAKQFTSAAVLALRDDGLLSLDDTLGAWLPGVPADKADITVDQLLLHTAGFHPDHAASDLDPLTREEALAAIHDQDLLFEPGTAWSYSNSGYTLAAAVVEEASGTGYREFLRERFFDPLGMSATGWYGESRFDELPVAHGYLNGRDSGRLADLPGPSWAVVGNGEVLSTADDLLTWVEALRSGRVLSPETVEELVTPRVAEEPGGPVTGAYGWLVEDTALGARITHNGGGLGGNADVAFFPASGLTLIALGNRITFRWLIPDVVPLSVDLPATQVNQQLADNLATGDFAALPRPLFPVWWAVVGGIVVVLVPALLTGGVVVATRRIRRGRRRRATAAT